MADTAAAAPQGSSTAADGDIVPAAASVAEQSPAEAEASTEAVDENVSAAAEHGDGAAAAAADDAAAATTLTSSHTDPAVQPDAAAATATTTAAEPPEASDEPSQTPPTPQAADASAEKGLQDSPAAAAADNGTSDATPSPSPPPSATPADDAAAATTSGAVGDDSSSSSSSSSEPCAAGDPLTAAAAATSAGAAAHPKKPSRAAALRGDDESTTSDDDDDDDEACVGGDPLAAAAAPAEPATPSTAVAERVEDEESELVASPLPRFGTSDTVDDAASPTQSGSPCDSIVEEVEECTESISQMDGVMLLLNALHVDSSVGRGNGVGGEGEPDWRAICQGCGMVGHSNSEVDDMVWFVQTGNVATVRRRTEQDTWLVDHPDVEWEKTLYLNVIANWRFELTVAVVTADHVAMEWTTRRVYASPQKAVDDGRGNVTYEDTYPDLYFNIEDYSDAFADMRLSYGQSWALEVSALSSTGQRVQVVKGKLSYEKLLKKVQLAARGAQAGHEELIRVKAPRGEGWLQLTCSIAPEAKSDVSVDPKPSDGSNPIVKLAYRAAYKALSTFEGTGEKVYATPALQCYLKHVTATSSHIIQKIMQLQHNHTEEWIRMPGARSVSRTTLLPAADQSVQSVAGGVSTVVGDGGLLPAPPAPSSDSNSFHVATPSADAAEDPRGGGSGSPCDPVSVEIAYQPQPATLDAPSDPALRVRWTRCFSEAPPVFVDVVIGSVFHGWVAKRGGRRVFATQAYRPRMVVITAHGLLHYFPDASPHSEARGTCCLVGARLKRRQRTSARAPNANVLEVHPATPRRPGSKGDPAFHFGFDATEKADALAEMIIPFAIMPP
eukprot:Rhum_TRINITY_DN14711_c16_g1::Rhum_TRINITY_DN14711_c16_g1_i1::g.111684::m.111684